MPNILKRLELNGFKSFAEKTVLEFPEGITAIVGPNGSGKSNVIDAIRWLLGERETKNLRGGTVEDLIFAGTSKRPRMGQAQASLHFENHKNFFPIDVAEVTVTRKVNRSGVSKYFLNKSEVRLKDLVDFFAQARLGSRGMAVITQGNSDIFIRASGAERREMIEEVLGLREYQIKKAEAERRLRNASLNLEKVHALTQEILPHLRSLRRQAGKWEKREKFEEELRERENQFFGSQWHDLHSKLKEVEDDMRHHKESLVSLTKEKEQAEARIGEVEANEPRERQKLKEIKLHTQKILEERSTLQKELGRLEAQIELEVKARDSAEVEGEKLIGLIRNIRNTLEQSLEGDPASLIGVVQAVLKDIRLVLGEGGGVHAESQPKFTPELTETR